MFAVLRPPLSMIDGAKIQTNFQRPTILTVHIVNNFRPSPLIFIKLSLLIPFLYAISNNGLISFVIVVHRFVKFVVVDAYNTILCFVIMNRSFYCLVDSCIQRVVMTLRYRLQLEQVYAFNLEAFHTPSLFVVCSV